MIMESRNCSLALIWWRVDILASSSTIFWLNRRHESQPGEQLRGGIVQLASLASSNVDGGLLLKPKNLHKSKYNAGAPACISKLWIARYCYQNMEQIRFPRRQNPEWFALTPASRQANQPLAQQIPRRQLTEWRKVLQSFANNGETAARQVRLKYS